MRTALLIVLVLLLVGVIPVHGWSRSWGYYPTGIVATLLVVLLVLAIIGRSPL